MNNNLQHHGIKGQKWGVRRFQKKGGGLTPAGKQRYSGDERRAQMKKIAKRKDIRESDRKTAEYASKKLPGRVALAVRGAVIRGVLSDIVKNGSVSSETAKSIAKAATMNFAEQELRAMSVSAKYDKDGKGNNSKGIMSREDVASYAFHMTKVASPYLAKGMATKYSKVKAEREANQRRFEEWGGRILEQSFDSIVNLSSDEYRIKD